MAKVGVCPECHLGDIPVVQGLTSEALAEIAEDCNPNESLDEFIDNAGEWILDDHNNFAGQYCPGSGTEAQETYNNQAVDQNPDDAYDSWE